VVQESTVDTKIRRQVSTPIAQHLTKVWKITAVDSQRTSRWKTASPINMAKRHRQARGHQQPHGKALLGLCMSPVVSKPLATLTITPAGKLMERRRPAAAQRGLGDLAVRCPDGPVKVTPGKYPRASASRLTR
jgi:hypothetical protein